MLTRLKARMLLSECYGDEIWSPELCREKGIPEVWVEELSAAYESGYRSDRETIYHAGSPTNQYHGVRDVDLAHRLAEYLGVDSQHVTALQLGREAEVRALKEAADEL